MKYKLREHWFLLMVFMPLISVFFIVFFDLELAKKIWEFLDENNIDIIKNQTLFKYINKEFLFFSGIGYVFIFLFYWIFKDRKKLFLKEDKFRTIIVFLLGISVLIWFYTRLVHIFIFTIMAVLIVYGITKKQRYKQSINTTFLLLYVLLQFIGILWNIDVFKAYFLKYPANITNQLMLLAPVVTLFFFRFTTQEKNLFVAILFKFFFLYIILHLISYLLLVNYFDKNIFSCFVFNKRYLPYYLVFQYSKYQHPSMISTLLIIIGSVSYVYYRSGSTWIKRTELFIYWIMLFCFVFIVQARVAQIGYFIVLAFVFSFEISKHISRRQQIAIILLGILLFLVGIYGVIRFTSFLNDPARAIIYNAGLESIKTNNPLWGAGTYSEIMIFEKMDILKNGTVHFHNDFLQAFVKYGIIGFLLLFLWVVFAFVDSFKKKNLALFFFMIPTLLFMMTDTAINHYRVLIVNAVFLFVFLEKGIKIESKKDE